MFRSTAVALALLTGSVAMAQDVELTGTQTLASADDWVFAGSAWSLRDGRLTQASTEGQLRAFYRQAVFGDVSVQVRFRVHDDGSGVKAAGLILRSTDSRNAIIIRYDTKNSQVIVTRDGIGEGRHKAEHKSKVTIDTGKWHTARTDATGDEIKVFLDGKLLLTVKDATLPAGRVGVCTNQGKVDFEAFHVMGREAKPSSPWRMRTSHEVPKEQALATILSIKVICKQPGRFIGWPTIARRADGELLAVFSGDRDAHVCPYGKMQMIRSLDDGKTWSSPETVVDTILDDRGTGILVCTSGVIILDWITSLNFEEKEQDCRERSGDAMVDSWQPYIAKITDADRKSEQGQWICRSLDGGRTWLPRQSVAGITPHGFAQLQDGRLLSVTGRTTTKRGVIAHESTDDGASWREIGRVPFPDGYGDAYWGEPHVTQATGGRLVAQFRHCRGKYAGYLFQSESDDGGKTWTEAHRLQVRGLPPHLLRLGDGRLLTSYGWRRDPYGEYACISRDGGATWDVKNEIKLASATRPDIGYPCSTQLADGSIYTIYYQPEHPGEQPCLMATHWRLKN